MCSPLKVQKHSGLCRSSGLVSHPLSGKSELHYYLVSLSCKWHCLVVNSQGLPSCLLLFVSSCMEHRQLHCWAWLECGGCSRMWFSYQQEPGTISLLSGFVSFRDSFVLLLPSNCDRAVTSTEIFRVESRCWKISFIQRYHRVSNFFEMHLSDLYCPY